MNTGEAQIASVNVKCIQQVYIGNGTSIYLRGVDWEKKRLYFNGKPTKLFRDEFFEIEDGKTVVTEQFFFPVQFLSQFLADNGAINAKGECINVIPYLKDGISEN